MGQRDSSGTLSPRLLCLVSDDSTAASDEPKLTNGLIAADSMVVTRAIENEAVVVMCNIAGPEWPKGATEVTTEEPIGIGRTAVAAPFLGAIGRVEHPGETLLLASVDMTVVQDARDVYRIRHDLQELQSS